MTNKQASKPSVAFNTWLKLCVFSLFLFSPAIADAAPRFDRLALPFLTILLIAWLAKLGFVALALVYTVIFPQQLREGSEVVMGGFWRTLLVGIVMVGIFLVVASAVGEKGGFLLLPLIIYALYNGVRGLAMFYHQVGERIQNNINSPRSGSSFYAVLYGGVLFSTIILVPFIGLLVEFLLLIWVQGLGFRARNLGKVTSGVPVANSVESESPSSVE